MKLKAEQIVPNIENPRYIKDENFRKLVQSLKDFPEMADVRPLVVNKEYVILGGNMRFKAMQQAGWKEIPVTVVDWSEDKQKEFIIKDNVSGGEWDWDVLANDWNSELLIEWGLETPVYDEPEINLDDSEKDGFQNMTFAVKDEYVDEVKQAIKNAKGDESAQSSGDALYAIARQYNVAG